MQKDLILDRSGSDTGKEKRPVQRVPGPDLRIREKRESGENVGRPVRKLSPRQAVCQVLLRTVVNVNRVPLDAGVGGGEGRPVEDQNRQQQKGRRPPAACVSMRAGRQRGSSLWRSLDGLFFLRAHGRTPSLALPGKAVQQPGRLLVMQSVTERAPLNWRLPLELALGPRAFCGAKPAAEPRLPW